jgi:hypothetical protein
MALVSDGRSDEGHVRSVPQLPGERDGRRLLGMSGQALAARVIDAVPTIYYFYVFLFFSSRNQLLAELNLV